MINPTRYYRVRVAARECGLPQTTVHSAIAAGHIPAKRTACGLPLVTLKAVRHYRDHRPKPGRRAAKA